MSADPAGPVDGPNLYVYVSGNPVRKNDPQGTDEWDMTDPAPIEQSSNTDAPENTQQTCDPERNEEWNPNGQSDMYEDFDEMVNEEEGFTLDWRGWKEELERAKEEIRTKHIYTVKTDKGVELRTIDKKELARIRDIIRSDIPIESVPSPIDFMTGGIGSLGARGLTMLSGKFVLRGGAALGGEMAAMSRGPSLSWQNRLPGVQVRRIGDVWVKRVNPDSNVLMRAWGKQSISSQFKGLQRLGDMATPHSLRNGMLITKDVGPTLGEGMRLLNPVSRSAYFKGSLRLRTMWNDIQPRNIGQNGLIFDPSIDPITKGLAVGGGLGLTALGIGTANKYMSE